jgi:hypothetical protein
MNVGKEINLRPYSSALRSKYNVSSDRAFVVQNVAIGQRGLDESAARTAPSHPRRNNLTKTIRDYRSYPPGQAAEPGGDAAAVE